MGLLGMGQVKACTLRITLPRLEYASTSHLLRQTHPSYFLLLFEIHLVHMQILVTGYSVSVASDNNAATPARNFCVDIC